MCLCILIYIDIWKLLIKSFTGLLFNLVTQYVLLIEGILGSTKFKKGDKMNGLDWLYFGSMLLLANINVVQGVSQKRKLNYVQFAIYTIVLVVYFVLRVNDGVNANFMFTTCLVFLLSFSIELWELAKKEKKDFLSIVAVILTLLPLLGAFWLSTSFLFA